MLFTPIFAVVIGNKRLVLVLPAYNAAKTLEKTYAEIPFDIVDDVILVDDASRDNTSLLAEKLGIRHIIKHEVNKGYGGNQKTCYNKALELNADMVIMLHPDYQYTPRLIRSIAGLLAEGVYPVVFGSRIIGDGALKGGMPLYKYVANRMLTFFQNIMLWKKLSEYHTGYRAFTSEVLRAVNYEVNSNDFIFDNEMIAQIFMKKFDIGEISCPTRYFAEASSINFSRSVKYGLGVIGVSFAYRFHRWGLIRHKLFRD